uniref:Uncharacterized protein n=1 Tax=Oryza barthii TaxID=65489 RepID=A0A0D3HMT0_9ORYZ
MDPNLSQDQDTAVLYRALLGLDDAGAGWTLDSEEEHTGDKWVWTNRSINRPICRVAVMIRIIISIDMISLSVWVKDYTLDPHSQSTPLCV